MKRLIATLMLLSLATPAFADCDLKKDIVQFPTYVQYSFGCHQLVGKTFMDNEDRKTQIVTYQELIAAQKEQLAVSNARAELWQSTSLKMADDVSSLREAQRYNDYIMFGAGILTTVLAGYALKQASK